VARRRAPTVRQGQGRRPSRTHAGLAGATPRGRGVGDLARGALGRARRGLSDLASARRGEITAFTVFAVSLVSLAALAAPQSPGLAAAWAGVLRAVFGWGAYLVVIAAASGAVAFVLLRFGVRIPLPPAGTFAGAGLLAAVLFAVLHAAAGAGDFDSAIAAAQEGLGGGYLGGLVLGALIEALGAAGAVVALVGLGLAGAALVVGFSPLELLARGIDRAGRAGEGLRASRRAERLAARSGATRPVAAETPRPVPPPVLVANEPPRPDAAAASAAVGAPAAPVTSRVWENSVAAPEAGWSLPALDEVLDHGVEARADEAFDRQRGRLIEETLLAFGAPARVVEINRGPAITQFGVEPDYTEGRGGRRMKVKVSRIAALADDLALALSAPSIRIQAPVPGKGYVGIEVPNNEIQVVALRDVMEAEAFLKIPSRLRLALGQDVSGRAVAADLTAMPHLLIAGTTGSGKSVCVNAIISCLLLQNSPDELRFVMVDPKRVELAPYNQIPHLLAPVVVELDRVVGALQWVSREMNDRYTKFSQAGVRNIDEYNRQQASAGQRRMPFLVVVIDELADLMMLAPDETEKVITRLAQLARATGIHLVLATQRPSVDVVTGLIKANFPARIAFAVASSVDSRVVLDQPGAERLLGRGDMLFQAPDSAAPVRMQGAFVSDAELTRLLLHWRGQAAARGVVSPPLATVAATGGLPMKQAALWEEESEDEGLDPLFDQAVEIVRRMRRASISLLQRRLRIGYTRSARLMDQLEEKGIVGPAQTGSQAREVLDYGELEAETETRPA